MSNLYEFSALPIKAKQRVVSLAWNMFERFGVVPTQESVQDEVNKCLYEIDGRFACYKEGEECHLLTSMAL